MKGKKKDKWEGESERVFAPLFSGKGEYVVIGFYGWGLTIY